MREFVPFQFYIENILMSNTYTMLEDTTMDVSFVMLIIATICWFLAAISIFGMGPIQIGWLGLFFFGFYLIIKSRKPQ
jgi:hypothetical protein